MTEHVRADADAIVIRGEDGIRASEVVVGAATDVGRLRTINEDGYLAIAPAFVVVDGILGGQFLVIDLVIRLRARGC